MAFVKARPYFELLTMLPSLYYPPAFVYGVFKIIDKKKICKLITPSYQDADHRYLSVVIVEGHHRKGTDRTAGVKPGLTLPAASPNRRTRRQDLKRRPKPIAVQLN